MITNSTKKQSTENNITNSRKLIDQTTVTANNKVSSSSLYNSTSSPISSKIPAAPSSSSIPQADIRVPPRILKEAFNARLGNSQKQSTSNISSVNRFNSSNNRKIQTSSKDLSESPSSVVYDLTTSPSIDSKSLNENSQSTIIEAQTISSAPPPPVTQLRQYDDIDNWKIWLDEIFTDSSYLRETNSKLKNPTPHLKLVESSLKNHLLYQHHQQQRKQKQRPVVEFRKTDRTKYPQRSINAIVQTNNDNDYTTLLSNKKIKEKSKYTPTMHESKKMNNKHKIIHSENRFFNENPNNSYYDNDKKITNITIATENVELFNSIKKTNKIINILNSSKNLNKEKVNHLKKNLLAVTENLVQIIKKINDRDNEKTTPFEENLLDSLTKTRHMIQNISGLSTKNKNDQDDNSDDYVDSGGGGEISDNSDYAIRKKKNKNKKGKNVETKYMNGTGSIIGNNYNNNNNNNSIMGEINNDKTNSKRRVSINNHVVHHPSNNDYLKTDDEADDEGEDDDNNSNNDSSYKNIKGKTNNGNKNGDEDETISFHTADSDNDNTEFNQIVAGGSIEEEQEDTQVSSRFSLVNIFNRFTSRTSSADHNKSMNDNTNNNYLSQHEQLEDYENYINKYMNSSNLKNINTFDNTTPSTSSSSIHSTKDKNRKNNKNNRSKDISDDEKGTKSIKKKHKKVLHPKKLKHTPQMDNNNNNDNNSKELKMTKQKPLPSNDHQILPTKRIYQENDNHHPTPTETTTKATESSSINRSIKKPIVHKKRGMIKINIAEHLAPHTCGTCKHEKLPQYVLDNLGITDEYLKDLEKTKDLRPIGHTGKGKFWDPQVFIQCTKCDKWYHCGCTSPPLKNYPEPFVKYRCGECDAANIFVVDPTIVHQPRKRTKIASYRV